MFNLISFDEKVIYVPENNNWKGLLWEWLVTVEMVLCHAISQYFKYAESLTQIFKLFSGVLQSGVRKPWNQVFAVKPFHEALLTHGKNVTYIISYFHDKK